MSVVAPASIDPIVATAHQAGAPEPAAGPRIPGMALKAEIVLGLQLILRHRAPRLVGQLTIVGVGLAALNRYSMPLADRQRVLLLAVGTVVAACCSRPLAPGGALVAARRVPLMWWTPVVGRTLAALLLLVAVVGGSSAALLPGARGVIAGALYGLTLGLVVLGVTPLLGASAGAGLGFAASWAGSIGPASLEWLRAAGPLLHWCVTGLWYVLPLPWRVMIWVETGSRVPLVLLLIWGIAGGCAVARSTVRFRGRRPGLLW